MIIARSPLRITLGGGGTDLHSYYREHEGFLIAAAIDKYVYVTVMRPFTAGIYLKYSQVGACRIDFAGSASDHPRRPEPAGLQDAADRNHHARGYSGGNRARQFGQLHHGAAQGALHPSSPTLDPGGAGGTGLPH